MLGKVMKYEWISTGRILVLLHLVLAVFTVIGNLELRIMNGSDSVIPENTRALIEGITMTVYVLIVFTAFVGTTVYLIVRFYKSMYTDEGYLTHTLPVGTHSLLWGKTIVAFCWMLIDMAAVVLSVSTIVVAGTGTTYMDIWQEILKMFDDPVASEMIPHLIPLIMIGGILQLLCTWEKITASFALGQLANEHRVLLSIAIYIGLNIVSNIVAFVVMFNGMVAISRMASIDSPELAFGLMHGVSVSAIIFNLVFAAVFYVITYMVTSRKLNLE